MIKKNTLYKSRQKWNNVDGATNIKQVAAWVTHGTKRKWDKLQTGFFRADDFVTIEERTLYQHWRICLINSQWPRDLGVTSREPVTYHFAHETTDLQKNESCLPIQRILLSMSNLKFSSLLNPLAAAVSFNIFKTIIRTRGTWFRLGAMKLSCLFPVQGSLRVSDAAV